MSRLMAGTEGPRRGGWYRSCAGGTAQDRADQPAAGGPAGRRWASGCSRPVDARTHRQLLLPDQGRCTASPQPESSQPLDILRIAENWAVPSLPSAPPFSVRCRLLSPLSDGGTLFLADAVLRVDAAGRIAAVGAPGPAEDAIDLRPLLVMPGMVDLHAHLPQLPASGLGGGLDLLTWLERYVFPLEREFRRGSCRAPGASRIACLRRCRHHDRRPVRGRL